METKLQELTQKIYSEGIEKAKSDAVVIVDDAQKKATDIIRQAEKDAAEIIRKAHEAASEIKRNTESEMRIASKQALSKLKQQIIDLVTARAIVVPVKETLNDRQFVASLIEKVIAGFDKVELTLPESEKEKIADYFNSRTTAELNKNIDVKFDSNIKAGFRISPKNENYTISFTDEDFAAFFKGFMRPRTVKLLFGEE